MEVLLGIQRSAVSCARKENISTHPLVRRLFVTVTLIVSPQSATMVGPVTSIVSFHLTQMSITVQYPEIAH